MKVNSVGRGAGTLHNKMINAHLVKKGKATVTRAKP
jgi:hypothetical protein